MKHILKTAFAAAALATTAFTGAMAEEVKVGVAAEPYPPFTSPDSSGKWIGWEIEFMDAICAEAKLDCVVTPVAWDGIIPALTSGKIDMIIGSMSITEERLKTIDSPTSTTTLRPASSVPRVTISTRLRKACPARSSAFRFRPFMPTMREVFRRRRCRDQAVPDPG